MRTFGLIGYPLAHSFSKKYFSEKFKKEAILDAEYFNFEISSINELSDLLMQHSNLMGLNVTSPYKREVIRFLDQIDPPAKIIGAVNAVKIEKIDNKQILTGYNTDVYGFMNSVEKHLPRNIDSALILGTGGAADAVAYALNQLGIRYSYVSRKKPAENSHIQYKDLDQALIEANKLIVQSTPVGMYPATSEKPDIPYKFLTHEHILYDLIYNPEETLFLKEGKKRSAKLINGLEMLIAQAEKAWEIFNS
jgi:shikimate dehydrogenase